MEIKKRIPAKEKSISEIHPQDIRVRIIGTVIDKKEDSLIVDDGTGTLEVFFDEIPEVEIGERVRLIIRILPLIDGFEARGEILQKMKDFDIELYKKAREIAKKYGADNLCAFS